MSKNRIVVIKIGTKVITSSDKSLDKALLKGLIAQISDILDKGLKVIVVTSGAIGAGMGLLGMKKRPVKTEELQAAASIGQSRLMHLYSDYFKERGYLTGQILLTQEDFNDRNRYLNIKKTIETLLSHKAVPVINENDTVSTEEIKCGDNDRLSSLVSDLCRVDMLMLLTDVDGLLDEKYSVINLVDGMSSRITKLARESLCEFGTGGMASKLESIGKATASGIECVIANGKTKNIIADIIDGKPVGTRFKSSGMKLLAKKRWIAFSSKPRGSIYVDSGAREALSNKNRSLLASGIVGLDGQFVMGDVVRITDKSFREFARGLTNYSSSELSKIKGLKTADIRNVLGRKAPDEVIHKDNLVIL
ncbi:MAG: glutamate 5-kinase [Candidatus Omnitrophota bacterium]|nr:glutamate 5-kinase [Candidatus Omnitrophota bacterium]